MMKRYFSTFIIALGFIAFVSAQEVVNGPVISLDKATHDYGTITQSGNGACEFTVTNSGTEPLIISRCKGSCGCTVPKCDKDPIMPGATSAISVKYDTKRIGPINKSVTITSNGELEVFEMASDDDVILLATIAKKSLNLPTCLLYHQILLIFL